MVKQMDKHELTELLNHVADGSVSPDDAALKLKMQPFQEIGNYAKVDCHRGIRQGVPEVIYGEGKAKEHILGIAKAMLKSKQQTVLITRLTEEAAEYIKAELPLNYNSMARIGIIGDLPEPERHHHHHTSVAEITEFIDTVPLADEVKDNAKAVYTLIAEAESRVHGHPIENIHFHEVGSLDALADVLSVCELMHELAPDKVLASPVNVGSGFVKCTHGVLPVLRVEYVAYGTGKKNFETANVVRVLLGETEGECEQIIELACNLDDMTPEELGFAMEELFRLGALDVYFTSIGMKKSRSGVMLTCMCRVQQRDEMLRCLFKHTTTLGVREYVCNRYSLTRSINTVQTEYGAVRIKKAEGYGIKRSKPEYDDLAKLARENDTTIAEIRKATEL